MLPKCVKAYASLGLGVGLLSCDAGREPKAAALAAGVVSTSAAPASAAGSPATIPARELSWDYPTSPVGPMHVMVSVPTHRIGQTLPVLIALHGRGEAFKGPRRGARGWLDDYGLPKALERLTGAPLTVADFGGAIDTSRLRRLNQRLREDPYRGLIIVCPYTPDILAGKRAFAAARPLAAFIVDQLLPRVFEETPASGAAAQVGIDGVSLGGRASLLVGLERPEAFGAVAALQAAIDQKEIGELVDRARAARARKPELTIRLLTSHQDYFRRELEALSRALRTASVTHTLTVVPGDHSYEFNRGPGVFEMLTFHDSVLRGKGAP